MLSIEVLMESIVVALAIFQQKRGRAGLAGIVTAGNERRMLIGEARLQAHRFVPLIGDRGEVRIDRVPQLRHDRREWVFEILVLALAKAVPRHDDATAEGRLISVEWRAPRALIRPEQLFDHRPALSVEISHNPRP